MRTELSQKENNQTGQFGRRLQWFMVGLPFLFLWGLLINQLRVEWQVNPQYAHCWMVPFLCLGLISLRWPEARAANLPAADGGVTAIAGFTGLTAFLLVLPAFLWLPTRLVQEANPEWRMISWLLALEVIGLTLVAIRIWAGRGWVVQLAFPICFFLVAVPWPAFVEGPLIQTLTNVCASLSVEVMSWVGVPAIQHGNVIEVGTGTVGIDEACSGIRSFQSTLMISLFLGELYGLSLVRRVLLVPAGFILALLFNVVRISFLTFVAAHHGVDAIAKYHDPAGLAIMVACIFSTWLLALLIKGRATETSPAIAARLPRNPRPPSAGLKRLAFGLLVWLVVVEAGVQLWYASHEWHLPPSVGWTVDWPRSNPTFSEKPISERAKWLLRYDDALGAAWQEQDGTRWEMLYLRWLPGRVAVHLAKLHTPDVCIAAAGHTVETLPDLTYLTVHGLSLPFRKYVVRDAGEPSYVFYCLWEDRAPSEFFKNQLLTYGNRLNPVLAGRRNCGQRSLEIVVRGYEDIAEAESAVVRELGSVLKVGEPGAKSAE